MSSIDIQRQYDYANTVKGNTAFYEHDENV
jgi:hypothetical protein